MGGLCQKDTSKKDLLHLGAPALAWFKPWKPDFQDKNGGSNSITMHPRTKYDPCLGLEYFVEDLCSLDQGLEKGPSPRAVLLPMSGTVILGMEIQNKFCLGGMGLFLNPRPSPPLGVDHCCL